jgi:phosphoglycerate dehydrogenase-like enzyme
MTDVLYIPQRGNEEPWTSDFLASADGRVRVKVFDHDLPVAPQFAGIPIVVDLGGHGTKEMIDAGAEAGVKLWQVVGTGLDHSEVAHIHASGIPLANTPGQFSAVALAEHALLLILFILRRMREAELNARAGVMYRPVTDEAGDQVVCIVGLGASGRELAKRANALGMHVLAVDTAPVPEADRNACGVSEFGGLDVLDAMLARADFVSVHVPLSDATRHLIDGRRLALMKPTASLINVARGQIVDEDALVHALTTGVIGGAGIDVFGEEPLSPQNPLLWLENVVATPHMAGATRGTSRRRCNAAVENVLRVLRGEPALYLVPD